MTSPTDKWERFQVKLFGYYWRFQFDRWGDWHSKDSDTRMRRAWWFLWHWRGSRGRSVLRICGIALHSKSTPYRDLSEYGV